MNKINIYIFKKDQPLLNVSPVHPSWCTLFFIYFRFQISWSGIKTGLRILLVFMSRFCNLPQLIAFTGDVPGTSPSHAWPWLDNWNVSQHLGSLPWLAVASYANLLETPIGISTKDFHRISFILAFKFIISLIPGFLFPSLALVPSYFKLLSMWDQTHWREEL